MVAIDAVEMVQNFGRAGGYTARLHVVNVGWMTVEQLAEHIGESNAEIAALRRDLDNWVERAPVWVS